VISHKTKLLYGVGAFGYGSIGQTMSSFLIFYGTGVLGIPGTLMGLAIGISTVWDATTDPFVGHWSDNTRSRFWGKRHGWIFFAALAVAFVNMLVWLVPAGWPLGAKFAAMLVLLLVMESFNTCYSTPFGALGLDLSKTYNDRTAVQNYKTAFSFTSLLVPSLLMLLLLQNGRNQSGYVWIAMVTGVLCVVCAVICCVGTYRHRPVADPTSNSPRHCLSLKSKSTTGLLEDFFGIVRQKNVGRLIAGYAVSLSAGAFLTSLGLHVFTYTFQFSNKQIPIIMMCLIAGIIVGQPLWYYISRKTDKITALLAALGTLFACMFMFAIVLVWRQTVPINTALIYVCLTIFASGVATGCLYSLPISMFADCVALRNAQTGVDKTGKSAGFLTFCTKISNAVIMFVIGLSLDIIGFRGAADAQSVSVQNWLGWLLIAGVAVASVGAMFIYSKYSYTKRDFRD